MSNASGLSGELLLSAYRQMKLIREFEERLHIEIATGEIPGFTHLYAGQEAVAVGVCSCLGDQDYIVSTHRGFHPDGSGEVIAEIAAAGLEPFLGLHYPASDIPRQARTSISATGCGSSPTSMPKSSQLTSSATHSASLLDLSMSVLRSVSPVHIEYLRNMGVAASMSVSILREGKLWGLFACHHYAPRYVSFERRTAAEMFGEMFSSGSSRAREREATIAYQVSPPTRSRKS